jgi:recombination protein RecA
VLKRGYRQAFPQPSLYEFLGKSGDEALTTTAKAKALADHVNATMGKGAVQLGSDPYYKVEYLKTGIAPIDDLLQGGIPYGRFVEIFGNYSTLKSYVGYRAIAECQAKGELAALIDTEHAFDPKWAKECGVDLDNLVLKQPETGEEAIDIAEVLIRGGVNLIVFDSVAAALPKSERDTMLSGDKNIQPARLAQLMSLAMRKLTAANRKTAMIWINQTRVNVGMMFGNPETVPGGKALPYYASYRIALRKAGIVTEPIEVNIIKDGKPTRAKVKLTVAQSIKATLEKSKLNAPFRDVMFNFDFRRGTIDEWFYLATQALDEGLVEYNRGVWCLTTKNAKKYRGKEAFQNAVGVEELKSLLGKPKALNGKDRPDPWKDEPRRKNGSKKEGHGRTRTVARAGSKTTAQTKTTSTKSKTRRKVTRSKR